MASLLTPPPSLLCQPKVNPTSLKNTSTNPSSKLFNSTSLRSIKGHGLCFVTKAKVAVEGDVVEKQSVQVSDSNDYGVVSVHHVGLLCENLERSLDFYQNILGLEINEARPHDKLPYRGAWLWIGSEMIHLMELPNPDPLTGRPEHGGRDRHTCIAIRDVSKLKAIFDKAGIPYTLSKSGRPAIFARDPDANALEFTQVDI
ncbi:glyoxylase I 4 [Humulus lupulus]|uniref:glyoxylase I 4 n=1 Tax=Humulus lupulus TaxID=3486 RepID=UPI002B4171B2|nr:glyoxylase I 4 [Humulus lupulus]